MGVRRVNREMVLAMKDVGMRDVDIASRMKCDVRQIQRILSQARARGWQQKATPVDPEEVINAIQQAKQRIVDKVIGVDEVIVDKVASGIAEGTIAVTTSDYHAVAKRHIGEKQIEERHLTLDPKVAELFDKVARDMLQSTPLQLPASPEVIDVSTE